MVSPWSPNHSRPEVLVALPWSFPTTAIQRHHRKRILLLRPIPPMLAQPVCIRQSPIRANQSRNQKSRHHPQATVLPSRVQHHLLRWSRSQSLPQTLLLPHPRARKVQRRYQNRLPIPRLGRRHLMVRRTRPASRRSCLPRLVRKQRQCRRSLRRHLESTLCPEWHLTKPRHGALPTL